MSRDITLVRPEGLEPPTVWFEARYSIQLSYGRLISTSLVATAGWGTHIVSV